MKRKTFVIYVKNEPVEVSEEVYRTYWHSIEKERYLSKKIRETWIYLDHLFDEYENNSLEYSLLEDMNPTASGALKIEMIEIMLQEVEKLPISEQELIKALYFEDVSQREYARRTNQHQSTISKQHAIILKKLKKRMK